MRGRKAAEAVLDALRVLDQVLGLAAGALEQALDLFASDGIDRAAFRHRAGTVDLGERNVATVSAMVGSALFGTPPVAYRQKNSSILIHMQNRL